MTHGRCRELSSGDGKVGKLVSFLPMQLLAFVSSLGLPRPVAATFDPRGGALYKTSPFAHFARWTSRAAGHPAAFGCAVLVIAAWALTGPVFHFSDTWQLIINTGTTIATFLMVFLIQNTQNRDSEAMQIKLDELIRSMHGAHNALLDLEELTEADLYRLKRRYAELARHAREEMSRGGGDVDTPEIRPE
jgi:low affinity Fe/Cu permease